jgi:glutamate-1-semialdehyde aminotransferase
MGLCWDRQRRSEPATQSAVIAASGITSAAREEAAVTADLNHKNDRLRQTINQLVESHPELEVVVRDVASRQPPNATPEHVQANLHERARAIIEARPDVEHSLGD